MTFFEYEQCFYRYLYSDVSGLPYVLLSEIARVARLLGIDSLRSLSILCL